MNVNKHKISFLIMGCALLVSCSGTKGVLGVGRSAPDEFKVISNPPLSLPPDFALRPPLTAHSAQGSSDLSAKELFHANQSASQKVSTSAVLSRAEKKLLERARANTANPDIKTLIDDEYRELTEKEEEKGILKKVFSYTKGESDKGKDPVVDAAREKERIEESKKEGVSPAEGGVEEKGTEKNKKGLLNRVIGF